MAAAMRDETSLAKEFILNAFRSNDRGEPANYKYLCEQLDMVLRNRTVVYDETLKRLLYAFAQCVSPIGEAPHKYKQLMSVLNKYDWDRAPEVSSAFLHFYGNLVSTNGTR
jgi:hypothetical protein